MSPRAVSIPTWMLPWLLPAGLLGTVALASLSTPFAYLLTAVWGWLVFPSVASYLHAHSRAGGGRHSGNDFPDGEANYWRTKMM
jgi:hypothetical protein